MTGAGGRAVIVGLVVGVALFATGCLREEIVQPVRDSIAVHAVAIVGATTFGLTLSRVSSTLAVEPVFGATVRLLRDSTSTTLVQSGTSSSFCFATTQAGPGGNEAAAQCYAAILATAIREHETLELEIELPDGSVIRGRTTTPATVEPQTPAPNDDVEVESFISAGGSFMESEPLLVVWHDEADRRADLRMEALRFFEGDSAVAVVDCFEYGGETTALLPRSPAYVEAPHCNGAPWDSADVRLTIATYDDNYVRYAVAVGVDGTGVVLEHAGVGIERIVGDDVVVGVFGSVARVTFPLTLHAVVTDTVF